VRRATREELAGRRGPKTADAVLAFSQSAVTLPFAGHRIAQIFISLIVLLFSLTVHEMAHAWTADRLGDPTARLIGRVSLNPMVHADPIGTILFPLIRWSAARAHRLAKPVPVNIRYLVTPGATT